MNLGSLLSKEQIITDLNAQVRWEAIVEMVDCLVERGFLKEKFKEEVLSGLRKREDLCSTGIGQDLAIPHIQTAAVEEVVTFFARSNEGVDFRLDCARDVHFLVLSLIPEEQFQAHLETMAAIAKTFHHPLLRERLRTATTAEEMMSIFRDRTPSKLS